MMLVMQDGLSDVEIVEECVVVICVFFVEDNLGDVLLFECNFVDSQFVIFELCSVNCLYDGLKLFEFEIFDIGIFDLLLFDSLFE